MKVIKRNKTKQDFDPEKIKRCIESANSSVEPEDRVEGASLTKLIKSIVGKIASVTVVDISNDCIRDITVDEIQDIVEDELIRLNKYALAKHYIKYRYQHEKNREANQTLLDYKKLINSYLKVDDWRVKENSTVTYSLGGLILSNSGAVTANYWLSEIYDDEIAKAHKNADIHIHDLSMLSGYCFTGDTRIKTLDGTNPTFKYLVDNNITNIDVFSYDTVNNKVVIGKAHNPRITRRVKYLVKVTLATGESILCTPDHPFMLRDGSYEKAENLRPNMSLMPLYVSDGGKYCSINKAWNNTGKKMYLHRWVAENYLLNRPLMDDEVVHHVDGNKHNNTVENLLVMKSKDHRAQEIELTMSTDKWKQANSSRLQEYNESEAKRNSVSKFASSRPRNKNGTFSYYPQYDKTGCNYNHRVRKVERISLQNDVDVYDITVENYHNFSLDCGVFVHNCAGWSLKQLIQEGLGGITGKITSSPASHLSTLCNQMVNFLGIMQNEWAGAQAFSSFDTYLAPFVKVDNLSYKEVKQCIQSFIFGVNTPSRWGTQAPFTNITLDWNVPNDLAELNCIVGGKEIDLRYKDCQKEMDMINKAFIEIMLEGDANGRGFQYPIPTYSITKDFDWSETENNKLLFEMTAKYGTPYFSNYINSDMEPSDVRSMCCRLRLDLRELRKKSGGFFGSGESTGSIGVVTINMPRIGYLAKDKEDFYQRLDRILDISARSLKMKRKVITQFLENGLYPYTKKYLGTFNNHFSTIGVVGFNECCLNAKWIKADMSHKEAQDFTEEVLNHIRTRLSDYQEQYGDLYNLEATPAESTSYRLAKHDKEKYPNIITASGSSCNTPYYTNSSHLPVGYTDDVFSALDIQDRLQVLYTSGTVFHTFLGEKLPTWKSAAMLVRKIAENYKLPYFTLSPTYSVCKNHGYIAGDVSKCPICGEETEVYSRITGYYRPVKNWNDGKRQEFKDRKVYDLSSSHSDVMKAVTTDSELSIKEVTVPSENSNTMEKKYILVATPTCPNCKIVSTLMDKNNISYEKVFANENPELCNQYGVKQAPTLIDGDNKYSGVSEIKKFLKI